MSFIVYKLIKPFFLPPMLFVFCMGLSLLFWYCKKERLGKGLLILTFLSFYLFSIEPVAYFLQKTLVKRTNALVSISETAPVEAIIILSGGAKFDNQKQQAVELSGASWQRLWHGIELYWQHHGQVPILYSGDSGNPFVPYSGEALLAKEYAIQIGIPEKDFLVDTRSRTTRESGLAIKQLLDSQSPDIAKHQIILVTSERHLPRALQVMNMVSIMASPAPVDVSVSQALNLLSFLPSEEYFSDSVASIHEWVGIMAYKIMDSNLFSHRSDNVLLEGN